MAKKNPGFWKSKACQDLRDFVAFRNEHPETHPLTANDTLRYAATQPSATLLEDQKIPSLSTSLLKTISKASYYEEHEDDETRLPNPPVVVQVVEYQRAYESSAYVKQKQRRIRVHLVDGDSKTKVLGVITGDILQAAKLQLSSGHPIIRLTEYTAVNYTSPTIKDNVAVRRPGLIIYQYEFLCSPVLHNMDSAGYPRAEITEESHDGSIATVEKADDNPMTRAQNEDTPITQFHHDILEFQQRTFESKTVKSTTGDQKRRTQPLPQFRFCKSGNRLCSGKDYGIISKTCIAENLRPKLADREWLEAASEVCHFVDREVEEMKPSQKRNVAFWWIATQVYFVKGSKHRKELPSCIECAVRMAFPNKEGDPYCGYKPK
eukprot:scaffold735_cov116-Cylindrotheca_fusiformis.AAC.31